MMRKAFIYRFQDKNKNIIYVGKTVSIQNRIRQHFTKGHLPKSCYSKVSKIEYVEIKDEVTALMLELGFINLYKPFYNKQNKIKSSVSKELENDLKKYKWREYKCVFTNRKTIHYKSDKERRFVAFVFHIAIIIMTLFYFFNII